MEKKNLNKDGVLLLLSAIIELAKQDLNNYIAGSKSVNITDADTALTFLQCIKSKETYGIKDFTELSQKRKEYIEKLKNLKNFSKDYTLQELAQMYNLSVYRMQGYLEKNNLPYKNKKIK